MPGGTYAVKHLNPVIMKRPDAMDNYRRAEKLEVILEEAGITTCDLNLELQKSFFEGYLEAYDNGFRDYGSVFGVAYTWIEWLEYNITRALDSSLTADEQKLGITEVTNTLRRLEYLRDREESIISNLERILA